MELEDIDRILNTIQNSDIRSIKEINERNKEVLDIVYSNFIKYDKNKENKEVSKKKIEDTNYEYVDSIDDFKARDIISSLNLNEFFNLKFKFIGIFVKKIDEDTIFIQSFNKNRFWRLKKDKHILFRKLSNKDKVNIMLVDAINNL